MGNSAELCSFQITVLENFLKPKGDRENTPGHLQRAGAGCVTGDGAGLQLNRVMAQGMTLRVDGDLSMCSYECELVTGARKEV